MKPNIYLVVGCPGAGKSWICEQLMHKFEYVHHDGYIGHIDQPQIYVQAILLAAKSTTKPILAEAPFSISQIKNPLEKNGLTVIPVFIQEHPSVIAARYRKREGKDIIVGHLTRQKTYAERARELRAFSGTSEEVLQHLKAL